MPQNSRKQTRAAAIALARNDHIRKLAIAALAVTMAAACLYGLAVATF